MLASRPIFFYFVCLILFYPSIIGTVPIVFNYPRRAYSSVNPLEYLLFCFPALAALGHPRYFTRGRRALDRDGVAAIYIDFEFLTRVCFVSCACAPL